MPSLTYAHVEALKAVERGWITFGDPGFLNEGETVTGDERTWLDELWLDGLVDFASSKRGAPVYLTADGRTALLATKES